MMAKASLVILLVIVLSTAGEAAAARSSAPLLSMPETYDWFNNGDRCVCTVTTLVEKPVVPEEGEMVITGIPGRPEFPRIVPGTPGAPGIQEECRLVADLGGAELGTPPAPSRQYYQYEFPNAPAGYPDPKRVSISSLPAPKPLLSSSAGHSVTKQISIPSFPEEQYYQYELPNMPAGYPDAKRVTISSLPAPKPLLGSATGHSVTKQISIPSFSQEQHYQYELPNMPAGYPDAKRVTISSLPAPKPLLGSATGHSVTQQISIPSFPQEQYQYEVDERPGQGAVRVVQTSGSIAQYPRNVHKQPTYQQVAQVPKVSKPIAREDQESYQDMIDL